MTGLRHSLLAAVTLAACAVLLGACSSALDHASPGAARTPISISARERARMRAGMRAYLESIQGITDGLAANKMAEVARSAKRAGMDMVEDVPLADLAAMPPEFLALSLDTHQKFDVLASAASEHAAKAALLQQLGGILANCTACHASYRFTP